MVQESRSRRERFRRLHLRLARLVTVPEGSGGIVAAAPVLRVREIFTRFWPYARPDRKVLAASLLFVALTPLTAAASIWVFKHIIDTVLVGRQLDALWVLGGALLGVTLVAGVVSYASSAVSAWLAERFLLRLRDAVFVHVLRLPLAFFERYRAGDVVSRLTNDVSAIERLVVSGVTRSASYAVRILVFAGLALYLRWELALLAFVVVPLFWWVARHFSRQIRTASREKRRRTGGVAAVAEETLANIPLVQAYGQERAEAGRLHAEGRARMAAGLAANRMSALYSPAIDVIEAVGGLLVFAVGAWEHAQGRLTIGGLLAFVAYLAQLYQPIRSASRLATTVYGASASAERLVELLDHAPDVEQSPRAVPFVHGSHDVHLDGVTFRYPGAERAALHGIDLRIAPGETVAVMGPNGAGKSTLTRLLLRWADPDSGVVLIDGTDIRDLDLESLRAQVAVVLQETMLFDRTVAENISYGAPAAGPPEVFRAAVAAHADGFVRELPDGYLTRVGQRGRRLSGGQRQRLAIARALIRPAPLLILDEPTASLDAPAARAVIAPLRRLMAGRTTLLITHDRSLAALADRTMVLDRGHIVAEHRPPAGPTSPQPLASPQPPAAARSAPVR
ncbi:ABC transporter ATP-binding protein [Actinopolymorpha sp. B11F2]|uniref:ABC transporter ATP-binding protein n=1 Tax=Actinopolymorpha sp. B11F2 TaxID=3160862 RepID=UPI0032E3F95B